MKKIITTFLLLIAFAFIVSAQNIPVLKTEDLDKYLGIYSSTQMSFKVTISKNNTTLMAQATGQAAFPLVASAKDRFTDSKASLELVFDTSRNKMTLNQG